MMVPPRHATSGLATEPVLGSEVVRAGRQKRNADGT
jgi:hypothetical protein